MKYFILKPIYKEGTTQETYELMATANNIKDAYILAEKHSAIIAKRIEIEMKFIEK